MGRFATAELVRIGQGSSGVRYATGSQNKSQVGDSYVMTSMSRARHSGKHDELRLWPQENGKGNTADAFHETTAREEDSIASGDSEQMIIHRRTEWEVRTESPAA